MQSVTDTDRDAYEERVGIMEYDGGLSQAEAEQEALRLILRGKLCAICNRKGDCAHAAIYAQDKGEKRGRW